MDISIIIPALNSEKYLNRCMDSLLDQDFSGSFEIIVVDDGSTDRTPNILRSYKEKYDTVRVVTHPINLKQSVARGTGISIAQGKFIMFLDSDDWYRQGALEKAYRTCIETNADIVVFNPVRIDAKGKLTPLNHIRESKVTTDKLLVLKHFYGGPGTKIVRKELTENLISGNASVNTTEDLLYAIEILFRAKKICLLPEDLYIYFINKESVTSTISPKVYLNNQIVILNKLHEIFKEYQPDPEIELNILTYIEKWIYFFLGKSHFLSKDLVEVDDSVLTVWHKFPVIPEQRIGKLKRAMKNRFYCLYKVAEYNGLKTGLGLVYHSLRNIF